MGEEVEIDVEPDPEPSRLIRCADCGNGVSPLASACPRCGRPMMAPQVYAQAPPTLRAHRIKKIDTLGGGCIVQGLGVLGGGGFIVIGLAAQNPVGAICGVLLGLILILGGLVLGRRVSTSWTCAACGNLIAGHGVQICPTCRAELS